MFFVHQDGHRYAKNVEAREEGGTPDIIGNIRAGLTFHLKQLSCPNLVLEHEKELARWTVEQLSHCPSIQILGPKHSNRLAIFSFMIHHEQTNKSTPPQVDSSPDPPRYLHHNFVAKLLNDLFGIQTRAGCLCAGPYAQHLLSMSKGVVEK